MNAPHAAECARQALEVLETAGLLLESDPFLPCVTRLVAGEAVSGSWWSHPRAHDIHAVTGRLADSPDVVIVPLVSGKTTYIHRRLWPALVAIGMSREPWQMERLSEPALRLLEHVDTKGAVRCDRLPDGVLAAGSKPGEVAREIERRLLAHGEQFHAERGHHAKRLETWPRFAGRVGPPIAPAASVEESKRVFEQLCEALIERHGGTFGLPWKPIQSRRRT